MSTRCGIGQRDDAGGVSVILAGIDGFPSGVGLLLADHYGLGEKGARRRRRLFELHGDNYIPALWNDPERCKSVERLNVGPLAGREGLAKWCGAELLDWVYWFESETVGWLAQSSPSRIQRGEGSEPWEPVRTAAGQPAALSPADEVASLRAQGIELVMVGAVHARDPATGRRLFSLDGEEHEWTAEMLGAEGQRLVLEAARRRILSVVTGRAVAPDDQPLRDDPA